MPFEDVWILFGIDLVIQIKSAISFGNFSEDGDVWRPIGLDLGNLQLLPVYYCMKFLAETWCSRAASLHARHRYWAPSFIF